MALTTRSGNAEAARLILGLSLVVLLAACAAPEQPPAADPNSAEGPTIVIAEDALSPIVITEEASTTQMIQRFGFTPQIHHRALSLAQIRTRRMVRSAFLISTEKSNRRKLFARSSVSTTSTSNTV